MCTQCIMGSWIYKKRRGGWKRCSHPDSKGHSGIIEESRTSGNIPQNNNRECPIQIHLSDLQVYIDKASSPVVIFAAFTHIQSRRAIPSPLSIIFSSETWRLQWELYRRGMYLTSCLSVLLTKQPLSLQPTGCPIEKEWRGDHHHGIRRLMVPSITWQNGST